MRLYDIRETDVLTVLNSVVSEARDEAGNRRLVGLDERGRRIVVLMAEDDPDLVITTFTERR